MIPGEVFVQAGSRELNVGRATARVEVANTGDRPIQIGSHYHFFEANRLLVFDRAAAFKMRLDIPSGTSVRFEPGERKAVSLVAFGGKQQVVGFNALVSGGAGSTKADSLPEALRLAEQAGFVGGEAS
jgi:urease beta subunit